MVTKNSNRPPEPESGQRRAEQTPSSPAGTAFGIPYAPAPWMRSAPE
jgi:hypothetical protein